MSYYVKGSKIVSIDGDVTEITEVTQFEEKTLLQAKAIACSALIMQGYDRVDLYDSSAVRIFGVKRC